MSYNEEDLLLISGIQHFAFCPRRWALIHIEKQWAENFKTVTGTQLHERVDNPNFFESRGDILISRSVPLISYELGFSGISDVIEFHSNNEGVKLANRNGFYKAVPVEYKRGKPKEDKIDEVQLCLQAMCIEEMLLTKIDYGYLYYGEIKHRTKVDFDENLKNYVSELAIQMHKVYSKKYTPKPKKKDKTCKSCSLIDICLPNLNVDNLAVRKYINKQLSEV